MFRTIRAIIMKFPLGAYVIIFLCILTYLIKTYVSIIVRMMRFFNNICQVVRSQSNNS